MAAVETERQAGVRVLVVDDEPSITDAVATAFRYEGFETTEAGTGRAAVKEIDEFRPDLIILDVMLPDQDGIELARRLRAQRVLFTSGYDGQALVGGDAPFLQKPFTKSDLARKVRELLDEGLVAWILELRAEVRGGAADPLD